MSIRIGCDVWEPWVNPCFLGYPETCPHPGAEISILWAVLKVGLSIDIEFLDLAALRNGTDKTVIELMKENRMDMACPSFPLQLSSEVYNEESPIKQTTVLSDDQPVLLFRIPEANRLSGNLLLAILDWRLILVLLISMMMVRFARLYSESFKIAATSYYLFLAIFLGLYANLLSIELFRSAPPKPPVTSFEDLVTRAETGECEILLDAQDYFIIQIIAPNPPLNDLQRRFSHLHESGRLQHFTSPDDLVEKLDAGPCMVAIHWIKTTAFLQGLYCGLDIVTDHSFEKVRFGFLYRKEWETEDFLLSSVIEDLDTDAFYFKAIRQMADKNKSCESTPNDSSDVTGLQISQFQDIFFFWLLMVVSSVLIQLFENLSTKCSLFKTSGSHDLAEDEKHY